MGSQVGAAASHTQPIVASTTHMAAPGQKGERPHRGTGMQQLPALCALLRASTTILAAPAGATASAQPREDSARIIVMTNQKGRAGETTLTIKLAVPLRQRDQGVLIIDPP